MKSYVENAYFGEVEIFENCPRLFSVRAEVLSELLVLKTDDFLKIIDNFPETKKLLLARAIMKSFNVKFSYLIVCWY